MARENRLFATARYPLDHIQTRIKDYQKKIDDRQAQEITLLNETEILENRIAKTELEIEAGQERIGTTEIELRLIDKEINEKEQDLERQRQILKGLLHEIDSRDNISLMEALFNTNSFSDLFDELEYLNQMNGKLGNALNESQYTHTRLLSERQNKEQALKMLETLQNDLANTRSQLEGERQAKETLLTETKNSEVSFLALLHDLRQEQQAVNHDVAYLQQEMEKRLGKIDVDGEGSILSWPFYPERSISATFHDPNYLFNHLSPHSGIDLPTPVGTIIESAAPGYVAWAREGKGYGYYVMVIHADGIATLYAHLSEMLVEPDQFVKRGDPIGRSGGKPGAPGAGRSTGPHLHFEVRQDGIPVDPLDYLMPL